MTIYRGVAYYPEFWPESRWDKDIHLMKQGGINIVRIGEFAWTAMEPAEGQFDFDWLGRIIDKFQKADIKVLLCTPTAAPPAWLTCACPETLIAHKDGTRVTHGRRRHYCPTSNIYRRHSGRITKALARKFSRYSNIIGYQIDNELGSPEVGVCYCDNCNAGFRQWLRQRYGNLEGLNRAWQTRFWSVTYTDWQQIDLQHGDGYPSIALDIRRFRSDCWCDFAAQQARFIRENHPKVLVMTNMMGPIFTHIDYYKLAENMDLVADDLYFDICNMSGDAAACDVFRCMAPDKPFWITETGVASLTGGKGASKEQFRAWAFSSLARGNQAHFFFRWRTCLAGQEQDLQGILETSGEPTYRYEGVQKLFAELESLSKEFESAPLPKAEVAIINSYDVHWAYESARTGEKVNSINHLLAMHESLFDRNVMVDIIPPERSLGGYRLVVLPSLCIVPPPLRESLKAFVRSGGVVLATPQLATRDENNNYVPRCAPDGLSELFGLNIESHNYLNNANEPDQSLWFPERKMVDERIGVSLENGPTGKTERYMEKVATESAEVIANFTEDMYAGCPAATVNEFGKGAAYYVAGYLEAALMGEILEMALKRASVPPEPQTPKWVEVVRRGDLVFVINHTHREVKVELPGRDAVVGEFSDGIAKLCPYGVCIIRSEKT
ncbi:MAG: beta-galactosidase [Phycisphaerae bacterium]|nr:beta-galactosidase [Phycisphaerae bacterium]